MSIKVDWRTATARAIRDGAGAGLVGIGRDERVIVMTANLAESTRVAEFAEHYPLRIFDVGVAEQNLAGVAAGLAFEGFVPFISSYASFSPGRNWEQIRVSIAMSQASVKILGGHAGVATGMNGPSHQATEDLALMRSLPNMVVLSPCDATQAEEMVKAAHAHEGPVYIRLCRPDTPDFTMPEKYQIGTAQVYREGGRVSIFASGIQVWDALKVADELSGEGIECEVINISSIKPLDQETILKSAAKTRKVITIEDHQVDGGMGSAVSELLGEHLPVPIKRLGIKDRFGLSGEWQEVYQALGLDRASIKKAVIDWVGHE